MRELELISDLDRLLCSDDARVVRWVGDDAAVTRTEGYAVTSVDMMVDGVHFRTGQLTPAEIGHRALAGALSDLAAMGVAGGEAYMAVGLPTSMDRRAFAEMVSGARALAERTGTVIAGGDISRAPALVVSFTVVGHTSDPGSLVGRSGARPGDLVGVTGTLGGAGAGLAVIEGRVRLDADLARVLRDSYARPEPRLQEGRVLAEAGATAMIDLSDGLATDAAHIGRASGACLELALGQLPLASGLAAASAQLHVDAAQLAATAGEDYELCVCAPPRSRSALEAALAKLPRRTSITWIGRVVPGRPGAEFADAVEPLSGFEHQL